VSLERASKRTRASLRHYERITNFCGLKGAKFDSEQSKRLLTFPTAQAGPGVYTDHLFGN
jgi:hypothetical protein